MKTLNVKDPDAHRYAAAIAQETGETITHVVVEALRQRYERLPARRTKATAEELHEIAGRIAALIKEPMPDHGDWLYDEHGLPK